MKKRAVFIVTSLGTAFFSLLTSFGIVHVTPIAGIALSFLSIIVIPGIYLSLYFYRKVDAGVESFCRIFFLGIFYAMCLVSIGFLPGVGYQQISLAGAFAVVCMSFIFIVTAYSGAGDLKNDLGRALQKRSRLRDREKKAGFLLMAVLFAICFIFFHGSGEMGIDTDAPDHISYIRRSLDSGKIFPADSFFKDGDGVSFDQRKGMWHPVMSLWIFQSGASPGYLWAMAPSFLAFFYILSFWFFARGILRSGYLVTLAGIFLLLMFRGEGISWFAEAPYSKNLMQSVFWVASGCLIRYYREGGKDRLVMAAILALAGVAIHLAFALFLAVFLGSMLIFTSVPGWGELWRRRYWGSLFPLLTLLAIPLFIRLNLSGPEFSEIHIHRQGIMTLGDMFVTVDPVEILKTNGIAFFFALALSPLLFFMFSDRGTGRLAGTLFLFPALLGFNPLIGRVMESFFGYLYYRILSAAPLMCAMAVFTAGTALVLFRGRSGRSARIQPSPWRSALKRLFAAAILALIIAVPVRFSIRGFIPAVTAMAGPARASGEDSSVFLSELLEGIPARSVIASDPATSYLISACTDHFVTVTLGQHGAPSDALAMERLVETRNLFSPVVQIAESLRWLRTTDATYIVADTRGGREHDFYGVVPAANIPYFMEKFRSCDKVVQEIASNGGFVLFGVRQDAATLSMVERCRYRDAGPVQCDDMGSPGINLNFEAGGKIELVDFSIHEDHPVAGDSLEGSFCWRVPEGRRFGLPLEWTVRLDTEYPKSFFFGKWYSKQYRRVVERRNGVFYRWTTRGRIMSGTAFPDQWPVNTVVRQDFAIKLPDNLAPGEYSIHVTVRDVPYIDNRTIYDYLRNEDSFSGLHVADIVIAE